jgi:hypothetical protein
MNQTVQQEPEEIRGATIFADAPEVVGFDQGLDFGVEVIDFLGPARL